MAFEWSADREAVVWLYRAGADSPVIVASALWILMLLLMLLRKRLLLVTVMQR